MRTWGEQKPENGGPNFWPQKRGQFLGPKLGPYCFFNMDSKKGPNFGPQKRTIIWPPFQGKFLGRGANFLVPFLGPLLAHKDAFSEFDTYATNLWRWDLGACCALIVPSFQNRSDSQVLVPRVYVQSCQLLTVGEVLQRQP